MGLSFVLSPTTGCALDSPTGLFFYQSNLVSFYSFWRLIAYLNHTECIFNRGKLRITNSTKVKTDSSYLPLS